ncbi:amidase [Elioraea sp.]|uniref:amidase n=1 Tax=Elioraea sp. TaxID=2185103 RepID=UPI0025B8B985|nr:amidase family protein [Elioraea sp.]
MDDLSTLLRLSVTEAAAAVRERRVSPVTLVEAVLDGIARTQGTLNAFVTVDADGARIAARAAEAAVMRGDTLGPLHGVPFSVKDLTWTKGLRTTMGSKLFEQFVPQEDAVPVARLRAAGAILVGKTTTPEFGHKPFTESPVSGISRNPWDLSRTPGGSSGGAAAAVAAGLGPLALGTDGGGSIRIPAACCGVVGLKPTLGRVPHIHAPDLFANNSYIGPITRTVADARLAMSVIEGPDARDPYAVAAIPPPAPRRLRVGWAPRVGNALLDGEIETITGEAVKALGCAIELVEIDFVSEEDAFLVMLQSSLAARLGPRLAAERASLSPSLTETIERGLARSAAEVLDAAQRRTALYRKVVALFDRIDVLATPTISAPAPPTELDPFAPFAIGNGAGAPGHIRATWYPYTYPFNLTGHPALTVPAGRTRAGLPVGLQLAGRWHEDHLLLDLAQRLEAARPWAAAWPPHAA